MSTGTLSPVGKQQFFDDNGAVLNGGKLYTYQAGTVTPATTYSDVDLTTPNANPIILDAAGRCTIYLAASSYKYVLKTSADVTVWTQDNIQSYAVGQSGGLGEIFTLGGAADSPITSATYPAGATFDKLHAESAVYSVDSVNLPGTYALECMCIGSGGTLTVALVNISDGSPDTPLVSVTSTSTTGERKVSSAITFAASGADKQYGLKVKQSAGVGYAWGAKIVRTA